MTKKDKQSDNWSLLLNDLGIENEVNGQDAEIADEPETVEVEAVAKKVESVEISRETTVKTTEISDGFGAGLLDEPMPKTELQPQETTEEKSKGGGRKRFFDRFPKMNLFGSASKESFESVVEGTKAPSLGGKSFTSNTLEKVPPVSGRSSRKEETPPPIAPPEPAPKEPTPKRGTNDNNDNDEGANPWSRIASQVDALSTPKAPKEGRGDKVSRGDRKKEPGDVKGDMKQERKRGRKTLPSLFDEPLPVSEESATLQNIMESDDRATSDTEAEKRLHSMFGDDFSPSFEKAPSKPEPRPSRDDRRGHRNRRPEVPEPIEEDAPAGFAEDFGEDFAPPKKQGSRGRRGSRYTEQSAMEDDESRFSRDVFAEPENVDEKPVWGEIDEQPRTAQRSRRRGKRPEKESSDSSFEEKRPVDADTSEAFDFAQVHKSIPSWDDAIDTLIDANIARRSQKPRKGGGRR